jgi:hypothetical protein
VDPWHFGTDPDPQIRTPTPDPTRANTYDWRPDVNCFSAVWQARRIQIVPKWPLVGCNMKKIGHSETIWMRLAATRLRNSLRIQFVITKPNEDQPDSSEPRSAFMTHICTCTSISICPWHVKCSWKLHPWFNLYVIECQTAEKKCTRTFLKWP